MQTAVISLLEKLNEGIEKGAALLKSGALVAFPTETVYGLGANALDEKAVESIFTAKGRPNDNPLIVHVASIAQAEELAEISVSARELMEHFWPAPLTIVLKKKPCIPDCVSARLDTVGIRMPDNPYALSLIKRAAIPIAAPSANASGKPSPTEALHVYEDLNGKIPLILDGGGCNIGVESTVLSLIGNPTILRPGAITQKMLEPLLGEVNISSYALKSHDGKGASPSPGMKYSHYAPLAHVTLVDGNIEEIAATAIALYDSFFSLSKKTVIFATKQTYPFYAGKNCVIMGDRENEITLCQSIFSLLREADKKGYDEVILEGLPADSLGLAYMNRALRAAAFNIARTIK